MVKAVQKKAVQKAVQKKEEPVAPYVDAIFHISPERVQARGRSLQLLLLHFLLLLFLLN